MNIEVTLKPTDGRIICLQVTDQHGETYVVGLEFCAHNFGPKVDDVQVSVRKPSPHDEDIMKSANAITFDSKRIAVRTETWFLPSVWFEFHQVDNLTAVRSQK